MIKISVDLCLFYQLIGHHQPPLARTVQPLTYRQTSKFTRAPPPTVSGNMSEWPEFRAIWKRYGEHEFSNDEERAWAFNGRLGG